jgi:predicted Zn-dependent protease
VLAVISPELGKTASAAMGQAGLVTLMSFNREQERQADQEALRVVAAEYGHVGGAVDLFSAFESMQGGTTGGIGKPRVEFFQTHPLTANRVEAARLWAKANGVAVDGARRPLSKALTAARSAPDAAANTPAGKGPPGTDKTR